MSRATIADWLAARWYAARYAKRKSAEDALMGEFMAPPVSPEMEVLIATLDRHWRPR